jgi:hypothetical protein
MVANKKSENSSVTPTQRNSLRSENDRACLLNGAPLSDCGGKLLVAKGLFWAETADDRLIPAQHSVTGQRSNRLAAGQSKGEGLQELTGSYGSHSPQESPRAIGNSHRSAIERVTFSTSLCAIPKGLETILHE